MNGVFGCLKDLRLATGLHHATQKETGVGCEKISAILLPLMFGYLNSSIAINL